MDRWKKIAIIGVGAGAAVGAAYLVIKTVVAKTPPSDAFRKLGDINGDGIIDQKDMDILTSLYGTTSTSPNWNPRADLNGDGKVDILDASILAGHFGLTYQEWLATRKAMGKFTVQTTNVPIKEI